MNEQHIISIATELNIAPQKVMATLKLMDDGATIPFISRYRKEVTGNLDEVQLGNIRQRYDQLEALDNRKDSIIKSLNERKLLTDELRVAIAGAETLSVLEDIYLPFRPKRRTRATIAKEKGLEPLAKIIMEQSDDIVPEAVATEYINKEKEVNTVEEALAGARDIIAEYINEDKDIRQIIRAFFEKKSIIKSKMVKGKEESGAKFKDYFDWSEPASQAPSHRVLAMFRGEKEDVLSLFIRPSEDEAIQFITREVIKGSNKTTEQMNLAVKDCYSRLLSTSMEVETRMMLREKADDEAIKVFIKNLKELLMEPALGQKAVLAIDPGFRTGSKIVCLDKQGKLLFNSVIYISKSPRELTEAVEIITNLIKHFKIEAIAIGNGTGGRETEKFVRSLPIAKELEAIVMVNESGASIYSASKEAREEFPDQDVTVRGAVSIGRRLMDPLAELVKIDPKSIGVGQYQHDVDQNKLKISLDESVMSCVNSVGVEVNTASKQLLSYVSGLGPSLALNVVNHRNENGPFKSRAEFKKVAKLGPKTFEQCAGFMRIGDAENPLDSSGVHPESYKIVEQMAKDKGVEIKDLIGENNPITQSVDLKQYVTDQTGMPTLNDIIKELAKPGRDPRKKFEAFAYEETVHDMDDLNPGMKLPGIITNVTNFGAFVDIGVHQDGLVHISEIADHFVENPAQVVKVHQKVEVTVMEIDKKRKRISLSMKKNPGERPAAATKRTQPRDNADNKSKRSQKKSDFNSNPFADLL
jgi:protein Tex